MPDKSLSKLRIAITGARGRIATGLSDHLRGQGQIVELFSRKAEGEFACIKSLTTGGRISDFDVVLHLGWSTVPLLSEQFPGTEEKEDFPFLSSLVATANSLESMPKIVFFSTAAVYGDTGNGWATEKTSCRPLGRYAAAKLGAEKILLNYPNSCTLRITNVFGKIGELALTRPQGILPIIVNAARTGCEVPVWGDGSAVKDYIAASDLHRAVELAISSNLTGTFNVASGRSLSVLNLLDIVEQNYGKSIRKRHLPAYAWDVETGHIASHKLQNATGWRPAVTVEAFVKSLMT